MGASFYLWTCTCSSTLPLLAIYFASFVFGEGGYPRRLAVAIQMDGTGDDDGLLAICNAMISNFLVFLA